jgi:hypothetical protein
MTLWIIKGLAQHYNEYDGFVVRAESSEQAKELAVEFIQKQGADYCDTPQRIQISCCEQIDVNGPPSIILNSFKDEDLDHPS